MEPSMKCQQEIIKILIQSRSLPLKIHRNGKFIIKKVIANDDSSSSSDDDENDNNKNNNNDSNNDNK